MDTFKGKLPCTYDFQIGYFTKKGNSKRWIEQEADLVSMYKQFDYTDTITIFFVMESKTVANARKRKRVAEDSITSASDHEEVKRIAEQLNDKHGDLWDSKAISTLGTNVC